MHAVVTPLSISNQLEMLESIPPGSPEIAELALNDLKIISDQILEMIKRIGEQITVNDMIMVQTLTARASILSDRFSKETPLGIALDTIKELMK